MKQVSIHLHFLQMPARPKSGNLTDYDRRCANCCLQSYEDCNAYSELGVPDCEPCEEFPAGSYFIKVKV
jgi:hypothetical protein